MGDEPHWFDKHLRNQDAVERIGVVRRQVVDGRRMLGLTTTSRK